MLDAAERDVADLVRRVDVGTAHPPLPRQAILELPVQRLGHRADLLQPRRPPVAQLVNEGGDDARIRQQVVRIEAPQPRGELADRITDVNERARPGRVEVGDRRTPVGNVAPSLLASIPAEVTDDPEAFGEIASPPQMLAYRAACQTPASSS
jgi:hypothetical protein